MFLIQHPCEFSSLAYLFGCAGKGVAMAVDVHADDVDRFVEMATQQGVDIRYVVDTHVHADHHSGGPALARRTGAEYLLHESAPVRHAFRGVAHGECLSLGNVSVEVLHTPGHTDDHICLLVTDHSRADEPWCLLTGHTLFPGGVGRPDLHGREREMAAKLHDSLFGRVLSLPDHIEILPGAQAGSACGGGISGKPVSTLGFEKRHNDGLLRDRARFVDTIAAFELPPIEAMASFYDFNTGT
ncbi:MULTISPECIES: MBL fold metallo-hydrolase [unclassified Guyparkeria]|uniref:MBL fold metallo-hydrolase n=1 Tax=unclassified Guyparkeria TaxID=2626246 RepID=UPI000733902F|nr:MULTISPECIES: MBL fold metallo-hydrolase [unclassified Guyparkeria]KTG16640.1 MBL fold metallo-hydrolase [Guyparkeria sp. XI15]OAE85674.1 MBL fold metallo-hydrolase [Guyparkeria sp. WRN-7]